MYKMNHRADRMSEQNDRSPHRHSSCFPPIDGGGSVSHSRCIEFSLSFESLLVLSLRAEYSPFGVEGGNQRKGTEICNKIGFIMRKKKTVYKWKSSLLCVGLLDGVNSQTGRLSQKLMHLHVLSCSEERQSRGRRED